MTKIIELVEKLSYVIADMHKLNEERAALIAKTEANHLKYQKAYNQYAPLIAELNAAEYMPAPDKRYE